MKSVLIFVGFIAIFRVGYGQQCDIGRFLCPNGRCIPSWYVCDGDNDCGDWSDEQQNCSSCPNHHFQCPNGNCIWECWVCDGDNDCGDWSDEPKYCPRCPLGYWQCPSGKCIPEDWLCDWDNDCGDWGDESKDACPCWINEIRCPPPKGDNGPAGQCILPEYFCNGSWDCEDGYDEINCTTQAATVAKVPKVRSVLVAGLKSKHVAHKKALKTKKSKSKMMDSRRKFLRPLPWI